MLRKKIAISGVFTGPIAPLNLHLKSAIIKHPKLSIAIRKNKVEQDEVANKIHHGGEMRVVHHYSQQHYDYFKKRFPEIADRFSPGSFGENILSEELTELELNIGDVFALGSAKVQVTVIRRPCATINYAYGDDRMLAEVISTGRTGWFYRVLEEGEVRIGDELVFLERPYPGLSLTKLFEQGYGSRAFSDKNFLKDCLNTGLLDQNWRAKIEPLFVMPD